MSEAFIQRPRIYIPPKTNQFTSNMANSNNNSLDNVNVGPDTHLSKINLSSEVVVDRVAADALLSTSNSADRPLPSLPFKQKHYQHRKEHDADSSHLSPPKKKSLLSGLGKRETQTTSMPSSPPSTSQKVRYNDTESAVSRLKYSPITSSLTTVGVDEVGLLLGEIIMGLEALSLHMPELSTILKQLSEIKDNLVLKRDDINSHINALSESFNPLKLQGASTPFTPGMMELVSSPQSSSIDPLPFHRAIRNTGVSNNAVEHSTASHMIYSWMYEMQKIAWIMNEKVKKYQNVVSIALSTGYHRRKLIDFCTRIRSAWAELLLELSVALAQTCTQKTHQVAENITKLAVATGVPGDWADITLDDAKSIFMQGEKYFMGYGVVKSHDIAFKRYEVAAKMNLADACNMLGVMLEFGLGRKRDMPNATKWYRKAAEGKSAEALNNLGRLYELGRGCQVSHVLATEMYKRAAKLGHLDGITNYAFMIENGLGVAQDLRMAVELYRSAADMGYARAQNALGSCYYRGRGIRRDHTEAVIWYRAAADQGFPPAQNNLGICYEEGNGIGKDNIMAKAYYQKAADLRHPSGTNNLGYMLLTEGDYIAAMQYFHVALSLGSIDAAYHLGTIYESGCTELSSLVKRAVQLSQSTITRQIELAIQYYQIAADKGHTNAQVRLATVLICVSQATTNLESDAFLLSYNRSRQTKSSLETKFTFGETSTARYDAALKYLLMAATPSTESAAGKNAQDNQIVGQLELLSVQQNDKPQGPEYQNHDRHNYGAYYTNQTSFNQQNTSTQSNSGLLNGDPEAQNMLGELFEMGYARGLDGDGDPTIAASWYRRAVRLGHARATFNLAALYETGQGVAKDFDKAIKLYREAVRRGNQEASERLATLADLPLSSM
ncbi:hypothetical protein O5D80_005943 [Batrachochytrium dendrobatidis]|nr:hypothetical protein O5D80_005943 [Batrachochytrium dendrobatidis]